MVAFVLPLVAQLSQPLIDSLSRSQLGANGELVATSDDRKTIYFYAKSHLGPPWAELKALPPHHQMILLQAGIEQKIGQDYLDFAIAVLQSVAEGGLSKEHAGMVLSPTSSSKEGFIPVNFADEKLAAALRQLIPLYADAPERVVSIEKVLSGKARDEYLKWSSLQGVEPIQPVTDVKSTKQNQSSLISTNDPIAPLPIPKTADPRFTPTSNESLATSTLWSAIVGLIAAAVGIAWILLKKRK